MNQPEQAKKLIEESRNILIFLPETYAQLSQYPGRAGDLFCAAQSLFFTLKKMGKNATLQIKDVPEKFRFLEHEQPEPGSREFTISINTAGKTISEMQYEKNPDNLKIHLAVSSGVLGGQDISFNHLSEELSRPDLIITLGSSSLDDLGSFFENDPSLFYETPLLNIDNNPDNENFGDVNIVEITVVSVSEIVDMVVRILDETFIDGHIATLLLAGIISASQNFQNTKIQPKTFEAASLLIKKGADHQKIIQKLFRQKSLPHIKLLGRVLENLEFNSEKDLYCASLTQKEISLAGCQPKDIAFVIEELRSSPYRISSLLLLWESRNSQPATRAVFCTQRKNFIEKILENFEGQSRGDTALILIKEEDMGIAKEKLLRLL
ncbi:MAG: hypothetical protein Q7T34_00020 [Candidatus Parcubacteria bacterium]|nr:hypothetical protein [Candidatus Parcubacteria bacterium]